MRFFWRRAPQSGRPVSTIKGGSLVEVGRFTYGHEKSRVFEWGEGRALRIGSFCSISAEVSFFLGGEHRVDWASTFPFGHVFQKETGILNPPIPGHPASKGDVTIGNDVWIGRGATFLSGVTVGDGAVVGARAVVSADIPPYAVAAGNPARVVRLRFEEEIIDLLLKLQWWGLPVNTIRELAPILSQPPSALVLEPIVKKYADQSRI